MFKTEAERQRAMEAGIHALRQWHGPNAGAEAGWVRAFESIYPRIPEEKVAIRDPLDGA